MGWAAETAPALVRALEARIGDRAVVVAAVAVDSDGPAVAASDGCLADARFELGSVGKTMTAALLALLVDDGTLGLDDEIGRWLAAGDNGGLRVGRLATHTSGLPPVAPNYDLRIADRANPWRAFTAAVAEEGLRLAQAEPGAPWRYSNFGYQLLGLLLERVTGTSFADLLTDRLLGPLAMAHSGVDGNGRGTLLPGHADDGRQVPAWDHPLAGAGGVQVSIDDLARYTQACLHPPPTPLGAALATAQRPLLAVENNREQALAWNVLHRNLRVHDGGTAGFSSCILIDPAQDRALALLASQHGRAQSMGGAARAALLR